MEYKGVNYCDLCFEPVVPGTVCPRCGLTRETVKTEAGLLEPGTNLLGKYIIGRVLGRGGFGATYLAFSSERSERVAIKEYFPNGIAYRGKGEEKISIVSSGKRDVFRKGAKRFFEEAKTMSKFNGNKNVVSVYEFFYANDTVYYSMEYLEGIDLKGYIKKKGGSIPEGEALTIMEQVADALRDIHSTGMLHRDISPDNIFICTDGSVKLIDFGAAKQVVGEQSQSLSVILKQGFAPVEQYQKNGNQGMWTDIYALGATIYYAVTGKVPEDAMSRLEDPELEIPDDINITVRFRDVLGKCMKMKVEERYKNALEVTDALSAIATKRLRVGGDGYVQSVYVNDGRTHIDTPVSVSFQNGAPPVGAVYDPVHNVMPPQGYPASGYPVSGYPYSAPQPQPPQKKSGLVKGVAIGVGAAAALAAVIIAIVLLMSPAAPQQNQYMPPPPGPPMGGQPPMQGGQPPMGGQPMQQ